MAYLLPLFKSVSMIFAVSAVATGVQAVVDPTAFSKTFGLALTDSTGSPIDNNDKDTSSTSRTMKMAVNMQNHHRSLTTSYISLMGIRQLATGLILLTFAYQRKWTEMATILAIIGVIVAGTDGFYLSRASSMKLGLFHAIPGVLIAALACGVIYSNI